MSIMMFISGIVMSSIFPVLHLLDINVKAEVIERAGKYASVVDGDWTIIVLIVCFIGWVVQAIAIRRMINRECEIRLFRALESRRPIPIPRYEAAPVVQQEVPSDAYPIPKDTFNKILGYLHTKEDSPGIKELCVELMRIRNRKD